MPLATGLVERLSNLAAPWHDTYAGSSVLPSAVLFAHFAALLVGGGLALAADRATLRAAARTSEDRDRQLDALGETHRLVVGALAMLFASGGLLFLADVETFAVSRVFWTKALLVALLLANGLAMTRMERALRGATTPESADALWRRLRRSALASVGLWLVTVLAGTVLTNG